MVKFSEVLVEADATTLALVLVVVWFEGNVTDEFMPLANQPRHPNNNEPYLRIKI